jgi:hypothetical protein
MPSLTPTLSPGWLARKLGSMTMQGSVKAEPASSALGVCCAQRQRVDEGSPSATA